ncbi:MAG: MauE/DoxX family redox-associated membrane protein [Phycisphaerales bacterium]
MSEAPDSKAPRFLISRIAVVLIALMWLVAGVMKVYDLPDFLDTIRLHDVLPFEMQFLGMVLPFLELLIALVLVFVAGSELRKPFGRGVLLISLAGILGFTYYLSLVPEAILQESGCGCVGTPLASGMQTSVRTMAAIRSGVLIVLHAVALVGPVITMRRLKS